MRAERGADERLGWAVLARPQPRLLAGPTFQKEPKPHPFSLQGERAFLCFKVTDLTGRGTYRECLSLLDDTSGPRQWTPSHLATVRATSSWRAE